MSLDAHLEAIDLAMQELCALSPTLAAPKASLQQQYIGTCVDNAIVLLSGVANAIDAGNRHVTFSDESNWHSAMQAVHRSFYSTIVSFTEKGCADLCFSRNVDIKVSRQANADVVIKLISDNSQIDSAIQNKIERKIWSLAGTDSLFRDYIEAAIKSSNIRGERSKMWRKYFNALSIVRNKVSHSKVDLSENEVHSLKDSGFAALVSDEGALQMNTRNYKQVCEHIVLFFNELKLQFTT